MCIKFKGLVNSLFNNKQSQPKTQPRRKQKIAKGVVLTWVIIIFFGIVTIFCPCLSELIEDNIERVIYILAVCIVVFLLGYYFEKLHNSSHEGSLFASIGHDLSRILSWLFSVNGLFLLVSLAAIWLVYLISKPLSGKATVDSNGVQVVTITLTITLSTLIPTLIARIIAKNQLNSIIDQRFEVEMAKFNTSLTNIRRDKGHASRMSAVLLEQMAGSRQIEDQLVQDNAAWAIGWAAEAVTQYILVQNKYSNALTNSAFCIILIVKAANHILIEDNSIKSNIKLKDLKSLVTMHALIQKCKCNDSLQELVDIQWNYEDKDILKETGRLINIDTTHRTQFTICEILKDIEKAFYKKLDNKVFDHNGFCDITGMSDDFNKKLNEKAIVIIEEMTS